MKFAIAHSKRGVEDVAQYLPSNYKVIHTDPNGMGILIAGEDDHGWTMDDYVLPRLASGLIVANEVWPLFAHAADHRNNMDIPSDWLKVPS